MLRTISLLALALLAHVSVIAALAHACGPQCGNHSSYSISSRHFKTPLQLGNRAKSGNQNGLSFNAGPAAIPQPTASKTTTDKPSAVKPQEQAIDHPADLPTNDPPFAASVARN